MFNNNLNTLIANTCDEESVDQMTEAFITFINSSVIVVIDDLVKGHIASRKLEGKIAETIVNIRTGIGNLDASGKNKTNAALGY